MLVGQATKYYLEICDFVWWKLGLHFGSSDFCCIPLLLRRVKNLFLQMINLVCRAPVSFFDSTPLSWMLNQVEHVFHSSFKLSRQSLLSSRSMLKIRHCLPVNLSPSRYHVDVDLMSSRGRSQNFYGVRLKFSGTYNTRNKNFKGPPKHVIRPSLIVLIYC
ncbi:hypothetical protein HanRHA438_Chr03g0124811 [Helianthus annuus]|uniref:Uncharacterized protein n=2 Tax=Helianthus annuus TaxID=4232 RepID=A0A9K3JG69_HELAN|nr:hypothetical protein HanXRQr2_Chr03g0112831 [Helianthus annuus]KAJ0608191.1 hypothetical protein HanHA89_Chr03g0105851 [Helianthus annuus]KAJ0768255.1 hypothetical protein HanLR1_Chr03g0099211 [Helianthus annuus]KAJ0935905.1 hypothetical protein HanRHA438_Chr03g0124811 [Helianthus annuus]KAJ0943829.1 hypothetical protein HanPSC8_Chr03g0109231 [Helianthus annuus]